MQSTFTLREYETARIGDEWDANAKIISRREVIALDRHQRNTGRNCFELGYRTIGATNWVGIIGLGRNCIEVIPNTTTKDFYRSTLEDSL